eukprot:Hpha_TRINITY_DN27182_c0_g1::TRINITY_DN27182_c0_g1_i1::g.29291::m.29291
MGQLCCGPEVELNSPHLLSPGVENQMVRGQSFMAEWMSDMQRYKLKAEDGVLCPVMAEPRGDAEQQSTKKSGDGITVDKESGGWMRLATGNGWVQKSVEGYKWMPTGTHAGLRLRSLNVPGGYRV